MEEAGGVQRRVPLDDALAGAGAALGDGELERRVRPLRGAQQTSQAILSLFTLSQSHVHTCMDT